MSDCILHTGPLNYSGYGIKNIKGRQKRAHRLAWEAVHGPLPREIHLHHTCGVRTCINVEHLVPLTNAEHQRLHEGWEHMAAIRRSQTHCKHGHPFDEENTYIRKQGWRTCMACNKERQQRYRAESLIRG